MMVFAGHITTVMGILIACVLILIAYLVAPQVFYSVPKGTTSFLNAPPQMAGKTDSFIFNIYMNAIIGNIAAGSFVSTLFPYAAKRDQKEEISVVNTSNTSG